MKVPRKLSQPKYIIVILAIVILGAVFFELFIDRSARLQPASVKDGLQDSERYENANLGFSILLPYEFDVEENGDSSILLVPKVQEPGPGPANFVYISVATPDKFVEAGGAYNYSAKLFESTDSLSIGDSISLADGSQPEFDEWFTYTFSEEVAIDGNQAKVFVKLRPWEFPSGTTETRYIFENNGNRYTLGYYTGGDGVTSFVDPRVARAIIESFKITGSPITKDPLNIEDTAQVELIKTQIKEAIVEKRGEQARNLTITVAKIEGDYAQGGASEIGMGGGMWFAAKKGGQWQLVWDGNGIINCDELAGYPDFPNSIIPECYDEVSEQLVKR